MYPQTNTLTYTTLFRSEEEARRKGKSVADLASDQAAKWQAGLASWGQDGARIARLKNAAEFTIYTPGSTAGIRSEEHTSELQSPCNLVCRLLLEKKK